MYICNVTSPNIRDMIFQSIGRLVRLCPLAMFLLLCTPLIGQTVLLNDPGNSYNDTDGPTFDVYGPVDVTNCSSVRFEMDYSFSLPWEGSGNMESSDECAFGIPPCAGDPRSPLGPCANCWDFLWAQFMIDGAEVGGDLIGEAGTTNSEQSGRITLDWCTGGRAASAAINVTTQTWAADERVTFSALMIICYEGLPDANANPNPLCDDEELDLIGRVDDPGVVDLSEWTGPGTIDDPLSLNTTVSDIPPGSATYTLTTTDVNGCTASDQVTVIVHPTPDAFPAGPLTLCTTSGGQADFDLTVLNATVSGGSGDPVLWYRDINLTSLIPNPNAFRTGSTFVYAVVDNGFCQSEVIEVELIVLPTPLAFPTTLEACEEVTGTGRATFDLDEIDDVVSGGRGGVDVMYYSDPGGLVPVPNPFQTGTTTIYARVSNGECESNLVEIKIFVFPRPRGRNYTVKFCEDPDMPGQVEVNLDSIVDSMRLIPSHTGRFFDDIFLSQTVSSPFTANEGITILYLQLSDGRCESDPIQLTIEVVKAPTITIEDLAVCEDPPGSGIGLFDLDSLAQVIVGGQPDISLEWFADSMASQLFNHPYRGSDTTVYVRASNGACFSQLLPLRLITIPPPQALPHSDTVCANELGLGEFILSRFLSFISSDTGRQRIEFAQDSNFNQIITADTLVVQDSTIYARVLDGGCASQFVLVHLVVLPSPAIDSIGQITGCDSVILPVITGQNISGNGAFYEFPDRGGNQWNPGDVIYSSQTLYGYDSNGECDDQIEIDIIIHTSPNAGASSRIAICDGANIQLNQNLLQGDAGGSFRDDSLSGAVAMDTFFSTGFAGRTLSFTYFINGMAPCMGDSATLFVDVVEEVDAGLDSMAIYCVGDTVLLENLLRQADFGGQFTDLSNSGGLIGNVFYSSDSGPGRFDLIYTIGDGVVCPESQSAITIIIEDGVDINPIPDTSVCGFFVLPALSGTNADLASYFSLPQGMGATWQVGDTIRTNQTIYAYGTSGNCPDEITFNVTILSESRFTLQSTICADSSIQVGNETFDINNPIGMVELSGQANNGCDSLVEVNLSFYPAAMDTIRQEICWNDGIMVNGTRYDSLNPSGTETLSNQSINGCDSTVFIDLTFYDARFRFDSTLCEGGFVTVGGEVFDIDRPSGMVDLPGQGKMGCDSIIWVNLRFDSDVQFDLTEQLCAGESRMVNGRVFDITNPSGSETIMGGASNGCDSIVNVNLTFFPSADTVIAGNICEGDTLIINGRAYHHNNLIGIDTLPNASHTGCDSFLAVQLNATSRGFYVLHDTLCPDDEIIINGEVFNSNRPSGEQVIPGGSTNGCDSVVQVELNFANFSLTPDYQEFDLVLGESINIDFITDFPYESITWSDTSGVGCTNCLSTLLSPTQSTTYTIIFEDDQGCTLEAVIVVRVRVIRDVFVPNTFSPNGDNINDNLMVFAKDGVIEEIENFEIYSRWGELVYQENGSRLSDQTHMGWNGTFNGEVLPPDVFVMRASIVLTTGETLNLSQSITLIR